jgi:hypothetical protein
MVKKILLRIIIFMVLLVMGFDGLDKLFVYKSQETESSKEYYDYDKNEFDVIFLGPSTMLNGVYPMQLYSEYGISSYNLACGNQSIASSYFLAKKVIKEQHPKVIMVDCFYIPYPFEYLSDEHLHYVTDFMGVEKVDLISDIVPMENWNDFLFPISRYHTRWKSLTKDDFEMERNKTYGAKVQYDSKEINEYEVTNDVEDIPKISEEYLGKLVNLCNENEVELVLTIFPCDFSINHFSLGDMKENQKMYNMVEKIAKENNIPCINFMHVLDETGIDLATDFDGGFHLNAYGAEKMTSYIGDFLVNNYELQDVREIEEYSFMENDYEIFLKYKESLKP